MANTLRSGAVLLAVLLFCGALSCGQDDASLSPSGVRGLAREELIGGAYPPPPPRFEPLYHAILTLHAGNGMEVARAISDSQGNFQIEAPPGTYQLVPQTPPEETGYYVVNAPEQTVVVLPHDMTNVVVTYIVPLP